jgi:hypothetical protein
LGSAAREIESAIDSDPGNALLWHALADTNARHFSNAANRDRVNDAVGLGRVETIFGRTLGIVADKFSTGNLEIRRQRLPRAPSLTSPAQR